MAKPRERIEIISSVKPTIPPPRGPCHLNWQCKGQGHLVYTIYAWTVRCDLCGEDTGTWLTQTGAKLAWEIRPDVRNSGGTGRYE